MGKRDYYEILGVSATASGDEIKRAYRRLAKKHHPDRNRDDASAETRFKEVQEAYDTLADSTKRGTYDNFGHAGVDAGGVGAGGFGGGWPGGVHSGGERVSVEDLRDLFDEGAVGGGGVGVGDFFEQILKRGGGSRRAQHRPAPKRGRDVEHRVTITFEQAMQGVSLEIELREQHAGGDGPGQTLTVKIPKGVRDGQKIRLRGKGEPGSGGAPSGDLLIACQVRPHRFFKREGDNIVLEVPISIAEATLGARVEVPSIDGHSTVTIPPGTASGTKLRLKDRGIWNESRKSRGHQYVVIRIVPPDSVTPRQEEVLRELLSSPPARDFDG